MATAAHQELVDRIDELINYDERLGLYPSRIILGAAAMRTLRSWYRSVQFYGIPELLTYQDIPVLKALDATDPWMVDVQSTEASL